jgi:cell wall-associated NlpC family hydrolase
MTTPQPPRGGGLGGLVGGLLGAAGSIGGTNPLQQSIDQLNNTVNRLINTMQSTNFGAGSVGAPTRQQNANRNTQPFPPMVNPFQPNQQQLGIGGGGNGGYGNITQPQPFGRSGAAMVASAVTAFGQQQMAPLLTLNQMATTAMLGTNNAGRQGQSLQQFYSQAGLTTNRMNFLASGVQDAAGQNAILQQLSGQYGYSKSALGKSGMTASAAFGLTNPTLGATTSAQLAAALYSPQFSQTMLSLGYQPIRSMKPGGAPLNGGQAAQSILQGLGLNKMSPSNLYGNLSSGRGQAALSALFGSSGISNTQAASYLEGYNQLFSKGLNANQANALFNQAAMGTSSQAKSAQARLNKLGVSTSSNDIQALKDSQAVVSGRAGMYSGGFNSAIQDSTGLLEKFNSVLSQLLQSTGAGTGLGYAGGFSGVMAGTSHAVGTVGTIGGIMTISRLLGRGGAGGASSLFSAGGGAGLAGGAGAGGAAVGAMAAAAVPVVAGLLLGAAAKAIGDKLTPAGTTLGAANQQAQKTSAGTGMTAFSGIITKGVSAVAGMLHIGGLGGGAAGVGAPQAKTQQKKTGGNNQLGGVSGNAKKAVGAAESQVGIPYVYGDEIPGVGFDCSGLVQWAYKQAGVNLPRTSQAQWAALKGKRVPLGQVQEGDLVFSAGSDGSASSPGHVGMMINGRQLIQAPHTGANVQIIGYNPDGWTFAARPSGHGGGASGPYQTGSGSSSSPGIGNRGTALSLGGSGAGTYGSANEVDLISAMGSGGAGGGGFTGGNANGSGGSVNANGTSGKAGSITGIHGGGNIAANKRLMQQMAQAMYGWGTGAQWNSLNTLEMHEAGYNQFAQNPGSSAYGIGQFLDQTWKGYGPKTSDPKLQIKYMLEYIKGRYGSPSKAMSQYYDHPGGVGWYGAGGQMSIVGDRGPELMMQTPGGGTQVFSNAQTMALINRIKGNPAQSPWKTDITSGSSPSKHDRGVTININQGAVVIHSSGSNDSIASKAGREITRQIIKHIDHEAVHQAIRNGEKL